MTPLSSQAERGLSILSCFEENERGECPAIPGWRSGETAHNVSGLTDIKEHVGFLHALMGIVVGPVPLFLKSGKATGEVANLLGKPFDCLVETGCSCGRVIEGPINLPPCGIAPGGGATADQHVGTTSRQKVKQGIVNGAGGPAQIGLPRLAVRGRSKLFGCLDQITRVQVCPPRHRSSR